MDSNFLFRYSVEENSISTKEFAMVWVIDPAHSKATFSAKYVMINTVRGQFNLLNGELHIHEEHPENSWVEAEVDAASIDTQYEMRDGHLKSPDFLDVEEYRVTGQSDNSRDYERSDSGCGIQRSGYRRLWE